MSGRGIEIGALWRRFPVPSRATVWYLDREAPGQLSRTYLEVGNKLISPDIVADAADLPFADGGLDFIIASHVLEHMPFPLAVLRNWYQALAPGGALLLKIPDKRYTFDARRKRTPLEHLIAEERNHKEFGKRAHFYDWVENVVGLPPGSEQCEREVERLIDIDYSIHYHAWTDVDVREMIEYSCSEMHLNWEPVMFLPARFYRKECDVILRKD